MTPSLQEAVFYVELPSVVATATSLVADANWNGTTCSIHLVFKKSAVDSVELFHFDSLEDLEGELIAVNGVLDSRQLLLLFQEILEQGTLTLTVGDTEEIVQARSGYREQPVDPTLGVKQLA